MSGPRIELGLRQPQCRVITIIPSRLSVYIRILIQTVHITYRQINCAKDGLEPPIFPQKIGTLYPLSYLAFIFRTRPDLNQRPFDLQSNALPLSYVSKLFRKKFRSKTFTFRKKFRSKTFTFRKKFFFSPTGN